jgi:hypothetical protein
MYSALALISVQKDGPRRREIPDVRSWLCRAVNPEIDGTEETAA